MDKKNGHFYSIGEYLALLSDPLPDSTKDQALMGVGARQLGEG